MPTVLIIPGLLGSELWTQPNRGGKLYWANPTQILLGAFREMRLAPNGVDPDPSGGRQLYAGYPLQDYYFPLTLAVDRALKPRGWLTDWWGYDWRLKIQTVASGLRDKIEAINTAGNGPVTLLCHSQGGLVGRAAYNYLIGEGHDSWVARIVTIGTPHYGSYSPALVFSGEDDLLYQLLHLEGPIPPAFAGSTAFVRGVSPFVRDNVQTAATFPSMYQLLPRLAGPLAADQHLPDLYDIQSWPAGLLLSASHFLEAAGSWETFIQGAKSWPAYGKMICVGGSGVDTPSLVGRVNRIGWADAFDYSDEGDGRVLLSSALPAAYTSFRIGGLHGDQPLSAAVMEDAPGWVTQVIPAPPAPPPAPPRRGPQPLIGGPPMQGMRVGPADP